MVAASITNQSWSLKSSALLIGSKDGFPKGTGIKSQMSRSFFFNTYFLGKLWWPNCRLVTSNGGDCFRDSRPKSPNTSGLGIKIIVICRKYFDHPSRRHKTFSLSVQFYHGERSHIDLTYLEPKMGIACVHEELLWFLFWIPALNGNKRNFIFLDTEKHTSTWHIEALFLCVHDKETCD